MAAQRDRLEMLHGLITEAFVTRLEADAQDGIPTDAATLGAITKFLKDNEVTADPADNEKLRDLKNQFTELQQQRSERRKAALHAIDSATQARKEA
ncbi:MAG: hypothetical protein ACREVW_10485 [Burkholderiales bacterium]